MTTPILLSHYALIFMSLCPMECRGRKNQEIKGTCPDPLPPSGSQKGGGAGYARLGMDLTLPSETTTTTSAEQAMAQETASPDLNNTLRRSERVIKKPDRLDL